MPQWIATKLHHYGDLVKWISVAVIVVSLLYVDRAYLELTSNAVYELADTSFARPSYRYLGAVASCTS